MCVVGVHSRSRVPPSLARSSISGSNVSGLPAIVSVSVVPRLQVVVVVDDFLAPGQPVTMEVAEQISQFKTMWMANTLETVQNMTAAAAEAGLQVSAVHHLRPSAS